MCQYCLKRLSLSTISSIMMIWLYLSSIDLC